MAALEDQLHELPFFGEELEVSQATRLCMVCYEDKPKAEFRPPNPSVCRHNWHQCQTCMERRMKNLPIPISLVWQCRNFSVDCNEVLPYSYMKEIMSEETFERYDRLLARAVLSEIPDFQWCLGPSGCQSGQINESDSIDDTSCPPFKCEACKHPFNEPSEDLSTFTCLDEAVKYCPSCYVPIEKERGCDSMCCDYCFASFCWGCLTLDGCECFIEYYLTPTTDETVKDEPVEDEPVEDEPVEDEPVEDEPVEDEPVEDEPVEDEQGW